MRHVHSKNRPPRADRKESLASLPFCCKRKIFEEFISGLFHGDPRGREGTSFVDFVGRGPGSPACRAYKASFLPLDWSAPSNWRSGKKKGKKARGSDERISGREKGRKRETDEEGGSEWREESNVCCRHANFCWTAMWKGLVGSSDLTARNLCEVKSADTNAIARHILARDERRVKTKSRLKAPCSLTEGVYAKRLSSSRQNPNAPYQKQAHKKHNYGEDIQVSQLRERGTAYKYNYNRASPVPTNKPEGIEHPHGKPRNTAQ
ncbi:hypothetical protein G5I_03230 [Acromyrmex echinatior]|uniref:Uncharacterized protein n=1 Tax=Acromyrmex echinatior TaxID=103372 RepID=F4WCF5_ACREC|nr:hypothetical protein G5I_03230 [Acromyrmex echinatior]